MRIGPRNDMFCANITTSSGHTLPWVDEIRYLGIFITKSRNFKVSLHHAKRSFYRATNAILGKVGRAASEEVIIQLVNCKCLPILLYGLEACALNKSDKKSLDFAINRLLMKLFCTNNIAIIADCRLMLGIKLPSEILPQRCTQFIAKVAEITL